VYRDEYIRSWIEKEILFQEAQENGILENSDYQSTIQLSKKELAASLYLTKILSENKYEPTDDELKKYFDENKDEFVWEEDSYKLNIAYFSDESKAIKFRTILIESDWRNAVNAFKEESSLIKSEYGIVILLHQVEPIGLSKITSNLLPFEISIVFETEPQKFAVVQMIDKFNKGALQLFENARQKVKDRFLLLRDKQFIQSYIQKLIDDHNIDIKRYRE
jgi:hypothetical protein